MRRPSTNTRGRRRRSDSRYASPVISVAVAGAFMPSPSMETAFWSAAAAAASGRIRRPVGAGSVLDLAVLHVLDLLFEVARAFVQHLVGLARQLAVGRQLV